MDNKDHFGKISGWNEENIIGNGKPGTPCLNMSSQLAELYFCSSASWKVELASDETGYLAEKVFKQHVERKVKVVHQLFATPRDYRVQGILWARILEWVAFPFSRGSSQPRDWTQVSWQTDSIPAEPQGNPRICLPVQETQVLSLVWEDPTGHGETALELQLLKSMGPRAFAPQELFHRCSEKLMHDN